ncbi:pyruvate, water dikinase regulatory protein [Clostridium butyricum]|uniref:pyruvate, water dikinase regulatory protein n=1 Tax=Clostridium butyricum TaxID=1492 RepID=UPI0006E5ABFE|nr:phosphotransferase [Clostridium butyricum]
MLTFLAVSDSIGETANQVAIAASSQFNEKVEVKRIPYIKSLEDVEDVMKCAEQCDNVIIISTIITVNVREYLTQKAMERNISVMNVLGSIINVAANMLNMQPTYNPGAMRKTDEEYFKRIEAMEFAMQYDDSKDYRGLKNADVVLIGLSRTSKTPLCMYLANKGVRAINLPLMPEVGVPDELYEVDRKKVFGLTINPLKLIEIRKRRLDKFHRITSDIEYAGDARVLEELEYADKIMRKVGCKIIDVTERAIEDTALIILEKIGYNKK